MSTTAKALLAAGLGLAACATPPPAAPRVVHGPYKDLSLSVDARTKRFSTAPDGVPVPVAQVLPRGSTLTWAFAIGECGHETLGPLDAADHAAPNVEALDRAGIDYIVSTGGEGGVFTCDSDDGMEAFIARYASAHLVGLDFDIEARQTPRIVAALVARAVAAQRRHPQLRFSFTLATAAASDGSRAGLNEQGVGVVRALQASALSGYTINLMVMDYGPPAPSRCVVSEAGACDMGRSAAQAVENLHAALGVPYEQIEVTAMIGVNDVPANDFTLDDARALRRLARERRLAGWHHWSLDRDTPCPHGATGVSATCSGRPDIPGLAFTRALDAPFE